MTTAPVGQGSEPEPEELRHALDAYVIDPSGMDALCAEPEFASAVEEMVAIDAPRLFAIVQEYGDRVDGQIAAWGMAFADHAELVATEGNVRMRLQAPEKALPRFTFGSHIHARLVWCPTPDHENNGTPERTVR